VKNKIDKLKFCKINKQRTGQCVKMNQYYEPKKLYPGDPCTQNDYTSACAYGLQICLNNTCMGVGINGTCARTFDCEPGQYCQSGRCRNYKKLGEACTHKYECGRVGMCLFNNTKSYMGMCVAYFSIKPGNATWQRVYNQIGSYLSYDNDTHLLCSTGYMDT